MKSVKIPLDENVANWVQLKAASEGKTVSQYLGDLLAQMLEEDSYEEAMRRYFAREPVNISDGQAYPKREELYDRPGLR